jgi:peptidyl-prolyl cis-trans isomerase C
MNIVPAFRMSNPFTTARAGVTAVWLVVMLGTAGPTFGQSTGADPVLAVVNGAQIRESDLQLQDEIIGRNLPTQDRAERRETLLKMLTDTILLAQEAKNRNIADEADLQRRMNLARNQGLMNQLLLVAGQQAVNDEAIRAAYEELVVKHAKTEPELHLRHMVFFIAEPKDDAAVKAAEEKAKAALERSKKGEDFAAIASEVSQDPVAKASGGDFGWRTRTEMGKEYADVAFTMKKGEVSPPIKTAVGWHIIKIEEDQRTRKPVEFDTVKERLAAVVSNAARFELIDRVRAKAKIERLDQPKEAGKETQGGK